jgi:hypothetical protein
VFRSAIPLPVDRSSERAAAVANAHKVHAPEHAAS